MKMIEAANMLPKVAMQNARICGKPAAKTTG
jgi:hypothetical protein